MGQKVFVFSLICRKIEMLFLNVDIIIYQSETESIRNRDLKSNENVC